MYDLKTQTTDVSTKAKGKCDENGLMESIDKVAAELRAWGSEGSAFKEEDLGEKPADAWTPGGAGEVIVGFSSEPAGAVVLVDGNLVCQKTPCSKGVSTGTHTVSMQATRYLKRQERRVLSKGDQIAWKLEPNFGWLTVRSEPPGLELAVNGTPAGQTPLERQEREPGVYEVLVTSPCYLNSGKRVKVARGAEEAVSVKPEERQGAFNVKAKDSKGNDLIADVYVDGKNLGQTPGVYKASVCAKELEVRHSKLGSAKKALEIREREVASVEVKLPSSAPVWVVNSTLNAVQVVEATEGGGIAATVPVGTSPASIVITPDGQKVYVANSGSASVSVISTASRTVTATITVGQSPIAVAATPEGSRIYVSNNGSKTVSVIDTTTDRVIQSISLPDGAGGLAVKPDGKQLWVSAGYGPDILNVLSIPDNTVVHRATGMRGFIGDYLRFLPNGSVLYVGSGCGCCGNIRRFDGSTYAVLTHHTWNSIGAGVALSPDGSLVYGGATGCPECGGTETLIKMDGSTGRILSSVALGVTGGMAVSPDGKTLYALLFKTPSLVVVDAGSLGTLRTIALGGGPRDVAVQPR